MFLSSFRDIRQKVILKGTEVYTIAELGIGVLDEATVRVAASVFKKTGSETAHQLTGETVFFRLPGIEEKKEVLENQLAVQRMGGKSSLLFNVSVDAFKSVPNQPFCYWLSPSLLKCFEFLEQLEPSYAIVRRGLNTNKDIRFIRWFWEVLPASIGAKENWTPYATGGDYSPYYGGFPLVVDWAGDGAAVKEHSRSIVAGKDLYFREGLCYSLVNEKGLNLKYMPEGHIFGMTGPSVFPNDSSDTWFLLGTMNSGAFWFFTLALTPNKDLSTGYIAAVPVAYSDKGSRKVTSLSAQMVYNLKASWDTGNELCTRFTAPWLLQAHRGTVLAKFSDLTHRGRELTEESSASSVALSSLLDHVFAVERAADAKLQTLQAQIDEAVYDLYEISQEDRALIERELGDRPPELVWPQMERKSAKEKRREHVRRLLSYCLLQALGEKRDGILPLTAGTGQPTALDEVRRRLETFFGEEIAFRIEGEIKQLLGRDIDTWLDRDLFKWHVKLYKRRPIVWHLASPGNHFACFIHIHKLDRDTLRKVQTLYVWPQRRATESALEAGKRANSPSRIEQAETVLDDLAEFEKRLLSVIQAQVESEIPDWAEGPFRGGVYDPVLDDGVKVNIIPLQEAGVLRYRKVV